MYICPRVVHRLLSRCTIVFPHYLLIGKFYEKGTESKRFVMNFSKILSEKFLIIIRNERNMVKNIYPSSRSVPVTVKFYNSLSKLSHSRQDLRKIGTETNLRLMIFSTKWTEIYFIIIRNERDMLKNVYLLSRCVPLTLKL
jgi:hypothetical protein